MNKELKQLILDVCRDYTVADHGVALTITGNMFRIILDTKLMPRQELQIMVAARIVYRTYFNIDGDTALDKDVTDIYNAMKNKLLTQARQQMSNDFTSLQAIKEMRTALQYDKSRNKNR